MDEDVAMYTVPTSGSWGIFPLSGNATNSGDGGIGIAANRDIDRLVQKIKNIKTPTDVGQRRKLRVAAQDLVDRLSEPQERVNHIFYSALIPPFCRVANDLNVLETLSRHTEPVSVHDIARTTGSEPALLDRLLRYLASIRAITEMPPHGYKANSVTQLLCSPNVKPGLQNASKLHLEALLELPDQLAETEYRTPCRADPPTDLRNAIAAPLDLCKNNPQFAESFQAWTSIPFGSASSFLDVIDLDGFFDRDASPAPSFVDVGGSSGDTCRRVCEQHPHFSSQVFLQDLDSTFLNAHAGPGVRKLANDFWADQSTHQARVHYFQNVLCRISNTYGAVFLKTVADAMADDCVILIDELVLPDYLAGRRLTEFDVMLMLFYRDRYGSGKLRTKNEWLKIISKAGLCLIAADHYDPDHQKAVLTVVKPGHPRAAGASAE